MKTSRLLLVLTALCALTASLGPSWALKLKAPHHAATSSSAARSIHWYAWYLKLHGYITNQGELWCEPGTPIHFTKSGTMTADTEDPRCLTTVKKLHFALPPNAPMDTLTLRVREKSGLPLRPAAFSAELARQMPGAKPADTGR